MANNNALYYVASDIAEKILEERKNEHKFKQNKYYQDEHNNAFKNSDNDYSNNHPGNNMERERNQNQKSYEYKIEEVLRNDPELLKDTVRAAQINKLNDHIKQSRQKLSDLDQIDYSNERQSDKISSLKSELNDHVNSMEKQVNNLEKENDTERTMGEINEQVVAHENERSSDKGQTRQAEAQMER